MKSGFTTELQCEHCGSIGPSFEFHDESLCRICWSNLNPDKSRIASASKSQIVASQKSKLAAVAAQQLLTTTRKNFIASPQASDLANAVLEEFGSMSLFAKSWYYAIQTAIAEDPGSHKVLRAHEQIARLIVDVNRMQPDTVDLANLADEDIEKELQSIILERIQSGKIKLTSLMGDDASGPEDV